VYRLCWGGRFDDKCGFGMLWKWAFAIWRSVINICYLDLNLYIATSDSIMIGRRFTSSRSRKDRAFMFVRSSPSSSINLSRSVHAKYSYELPSPRSMYSFSMSLRAQYVSICNPTILQNAQTYLSIFFLISPTSTAPLSLVALMTSATNSA